MLIKAWPRKPSVVLRGNHIQYIGIRITLSLSYSCTRSYSILTNQGLNVLPQTTVICVHICANLWVCVLEKLRSVEIFWLGTVIWLAGNHTYVDVMRLCVLTWYVEIYWGLWHFVGTPNIFILCCVLSVWLEIYWGGGHFVGNTKYIHALLWWDDGGDATSPFFPLISLILNLSTIGISQPWEPFSVPHPGSSSYQMIFPCVVLTWNFFTSW